MANTTSPHNKEMFDHKECWENYDEGDLVTGKIRLISEDDSLLVLYPV